MPAGEERSRLEAALGAIDEANSHDPNRVVHDGVEHPKELLHGRLVSEWVQRLDPAAGEEQLLAARAHHFRRWTSPRDAHPPGRAGYLRWRAEAARASRVRLIFSPSMLPLVSTTRYTFVGRFV